MKEKIIYLAADERPCNYQHPDFIYDISNVKIIKPPMSIMGYKKEAADVEKLQKWILKKLNQADKMVVSVDLLVYGGLIPARIHNLSREKILERINFLNKIKEHKENIKIYAFNMITRVPAYNSSDEEPDYYAKYGKDIYKLGYLKDKSKRAELSEAEKKELKKVKKNIPIEIKEDYLNRREKNHSLNLTVLQLLKNKIIDFLLFPMDDNSEYGFSASERNKLLKKAVSEKLLNRLMSYPGADESGLILLSRALIESSALNIKVYVKYFSEKNKNIIPPLEDRPLEITVKEQIAASGAVSVEQIEEADYILFVNTPSSITMKAMEEWDFLLDRKIIIDPEKSLNNILDSMEYYLKKNKKVVLADTALINGADDQLLKMMAERNMLNKISAYAGWNTSSNTIGSVISHANSLLLAEQKKLKKEFINKKNEKLLFLRYLDDWGYQYQIRAVITKKLKNYDLNYFDLKNKEDKIIELTEKEMKKFKNSYLNDFTYDFELSFPWNRMFEIKINIK